MNMILLLHVITAAAVAQADEQETTIYALAVEDTTQPSLRLATSQPSSLAIETTQLRLETSPEVRTTTETFPALSVTSLAAKTSESTTRVGDPISLVTQNSQTTENLKEWQKTTVQSSELQTSSDSKVKVTTEDVVVPLATTDHSQDAVITKKVLRSDAGHALSTKHSSTLSSTTEMPLDQLLPTKNILQMDEAEIDGTVTVLFDSSQQTAVNNQFILALDMKFRPALVKAINLVMSMSQTTQPSTNDIDTRDDGTVVTHVTTVSTAISLSPVTTQVYTRSTDNSSDTQYVVDDIWYAGLPRNSDGVLQLSIFITKDGAILPRSVLKTALLTINKCSLGIYLMSVNDGWMSKTDEATVFSTVRIWQTNRGLLLTFLILLCLCTIFSIIGLCARLLSQPDCCSRFPNEKQLLVKMKHSKYKHVTSAENPANDEEMTKDEGGFSSATSATLPSSSLPLQSADKPRRPFWRRLPSIPYIAPPSTQAQKTDHSWVVPMDQIKSRKSEDSTVELTRL